MKERPILFSPPMVRAILKGRKTQTRRVVNPGVIADAGDPSTWLAARPGEWAVGGDPNHCLFISPYGKPGDRLWVRETWCRWYGGVLGGDRGMERAEPSGTCGVTYLADMTRKRVENAYWDRVRGHSVLAGFEQSHAKWRPSIHMPRWASRLALEVTEVRVQRLQEISEEDARAEGVEAAPFCKAGRPNGMEHVEAFEDLWTAINGKRHGCSWDDNPWVWCMSFRRAL